MGIMLKKPEGVAGSALPAIIIGVFVAFGGVLFGYASSKPNSSEKFLTV
jgi:SP family sugar:H+ symporter-like MFS transporter